MSVARLAYISTARPDLTAKEVESIVEEARVRNQAQDITGLLVFNGTNFLQVIEGPGPNLLGVFDSICRDDRHEGVVRVHAEHEVDRAFSDWSMGFGLIESAAGTAPREAFSVSQEELDALLPEALPRELRSLFEGFNTMARA